MGKTRKQTGTSQIDPTVAAESQSLMELFRQLAAVPKDINRGVTVAGFTPKQQEAMAATSGAANAFGFNVGMDPMAGMPAMNESAQGIKGYSIAPEFDASKAAIPKEVSDAMSGFYSQAQKRTKQKKFKTGGGGKK